MLVRLIYVSEATAGITIVDVEEILKLARRSNQLNDISGMLLFDRESFLQVIEGDAEVVTSLFRRIANDTRHRRLKLLQFGEVGQRMFEQWTMEFAGESDSNRQVFLRHTAGSHFRPYDLNASSALALLLGLARPAALTVAEV
jgi:hypothetical protein